MLTYLHIAQTYSCLKAHTEQRNVTELNWYGLVFDECITVGTV